MARATAKYTITAEDKSARAVNSFKRNIARATGGIGAFKGAILGAVGVGGLGAMLKSAINTGDQIQKLNLQLGLSTEFLSEMKFAAEQSGLTMGDLETSIRRMQKSIADAGAGLSTATRALDAIGLSVEGLRKLKPDDQFLVIAEAISKIDDQSLKTQVSMDLLGRAGAKVGQLFAGGAEGVAELRRQARELGLSISGQTADDMAGFNDSLNRLKSSFLGLAIALTKDLAGPLTSFVDSITTRVIPGINAAIEPFRILGIVLGAIGEQISALKQGNFLEALQINKAATNRITSILSGTSGRGRAQTEDVSGAVARGVARRRAAREQAPEDLRAGFSGKKGDAGILKDAIELLKGSKSKDDIALQKKMVDILTLIQTNTKDATAKAG